MAENKTITERFTGKGRNLLVHAYRGIPEVHSWTHYKKLDKHWSVCGYQDGGKSGIPELEIPKPESGTRGSTNLSEVTCAFCLDLVEDTDRRQILIPPGRVSVTIHDSCFPEPVFFNPNWPKRKRPRAR